MAAELTVTPLTTTIGARIEGLDLSRALPPGVAEEVRRALDQHCVLYLPGQHIGLEEQYRFAETFGALEALPSMKFAGFADPAIVLEPKLFQQSHAVSQDWRKVEHPAWHTDSSFTAQIPLAAVLRAEIIPPVGGATSWTNMGAAYEALSPALQDWLRTLKAIHWYEPYYKQAIGFDQWPADNQKKFDEEFQPRAQPVVVEHPRTGRLSLFVNPTYTYAIEGLNAKESRYLLRFLFNHVGSADFVYRHRWTAGDIMVWDELATLHLAPTDVGDQPRRVVRVTAGLVEPQAPGSIHRAVAAE